ncbi:S-adenosylmethionine decarboxylase [Nocardiopsis alba]|uniref:S-adenosylmethionine decarboxylase n=2 Tax=Nocardiopsis alba TaxID=53437 RepID=A0ABV5DQM2_9ACTN|nr:S-adenosylmethionine decarboxylase [Nocardiopsis alba]AFR09314.1 S-adenosylmethionine decarboxylase family protein [Nocardiopsis alba ATCC BAA-2165]
MICLAVDLNDCVVDPAPQDIGEAMHATARRLGVRVLLEAPAGYPDHGVTHMMALAESHLVVSTWPEHRAAQIDLVSCRADTDPENALEPLLSLFGPGRTTIRHIPRWNPKAAPVPG